MGGGPGAGQTPQEPEQSGGQYKPGFELEEKPTPPLTEYDEGAGKPPGAPEQAPPIGFGMGDIPEGGQVPDEPLTIEPKGKVFGGEGEAAPTVPPAEEPGAGELTEVEKLAMEEEAAKKEQEGLVYVENFGYVTKEDAAKIEEEQSRRRMEEEAKEKGYKSGKQAEVVSQMEDSILDYLNQSTGIPPEELQGQIAGLEAAGYDQMAKFAQQMASRGIGTSGVAGAGMGQIMTQTMLGIANLKFENAKLAVEERIQKIRNFMAFYGNVMSESNKAKHLDFLEGLERDKFEYDKEQNAMSDKWVAVKNLLALTGGESWGSEALAWAFNAMDAGIDPTQITGWLISDGKSVTLKEGAPAYPGGGGGPPTEAGPPAGFHAIAGAEMGSSSWDDLTPGEQEAAKMYLSSKGNGWADPPPGFASEVEWANYPYKHKAWQKYITSVQTTNTGYPLWHQLD